MSFCASCISDIAPGQERHAAIGRNDAIVVLCRDCAAEPAVTKTGPDRGYEPDGSYGELKKAVDKFCANVNPKKLKFNRNAVGAMGGVPAGFTAVSVAVVTADGTKRDRYEALETLRGEPWYAKVTYVGSGMTAQGPTHVFARPADSEARGFEQPFLNRRR